MRQTEDVLKRAKQAVVVVFRIGLRARCDERRKQHGADLAATRADFSARLRTARQRFFVATGRTVVAFIEGDDQQSVLLERRRFDDARYPRTQERIGGLQSAATRAAFAVLAGCIVAVMAKIGRDVNEVCRAVDAGEILGELIEIHHAVVAVCLVVDDRVEVHERIVLGGVLILWRSVLGDVERADDRMCAGGRFTRRVLAHVFHVRLPRETGVGELVGDGANALGIHATRAGKLAVGVGLFGGGREFAKRRAVGLRSGVGRLPADHGDVVVQAEMADAVIAGQQRALLGQFLGEIRSDRLRAERDLIGLVLQHDDEHVPHGRQRRRCPQARHRRAERREHREKGKTRARQDATRAGAYRWRGHPRIPWAVALREMRDATAIPAALRDRIKSRRCPGKRRPAR